MYWVQRKIWQFRNICRWLPILINQRDFDYMYAIEVFKFQLQKTAEHLDSDRAWSLDAKYHAQRIRTTIKLIDKVYNEEYGCEYQQKMKDKYGEDILDFKFTKINDNNEYYELTSAYEEHENIEEEHSRLFKESQEKQRRAHKLLWKVIERNIQRWWD